MNQQVVLVNNSFFCFSYNFNIILFIYLKDSYMAKSIVDCLRIMANKGKLIICKL